MSRPVRLRAQFAVVDVDTIARFHCVQRLGQRTLDRKMLVVDLDAAKAAGRDDRQQRALADPLLFPGQAHFAGPYLGARQIHQDLEAPTGAFSAARA